MMTFAIPDEDWNLKIVPFHAGCVDEYVAAFNDPRRLLKRFYFKGGFVSTVFLVIECSFGDFFETGFFYDNGHSDIVRRYSTYRSAIDGHESLTMNLERYMTIPKTRLKRERKKLIRTAKKLMSFAPADLEIMVTRNGDPLRVVALINDINLFEQGIDKVIRM